MSAKAISLHIEYGRLGNYLWRDVEISDEFFLHQLGFVILATFDTEASHLFELDIEGITYAFASKVVPMRGDVSMVKCRLADFSFEAGQRFVMHYDYGTTQSFHIVVTDVSTLENELGRAGFVVVDGDGCGIIDNYAEEELKELIFQIERYGKTKKDIFYKDRISP